MRLTVTNDFASYCIECPDTARIKSNYRDTDYLIVTDPDDPETPYWLFDEILLDAVRSGDFGLRLISSSPLN
jgi:hypothetical protein